MSLQIHALRALLCKIQTTFGTTEAALINTDVIEVEEGFSLKVEPRVKEIALASGGWSQNQSVLGPRDCSISCSMPFRTGAAEGNAGKIADLLKIACMVAAASDTDEDSTDDRFVYTLSAKSSEWKDATFWGYSGNQSTTSSLITKVKNVMGSIKISLDFDSSVAMLSFDGKGALVADPALGTMPTITPSAVVTQALRAATVSFFSDADYKLISLDIDIGPEVTTTLSPGIADGSELGQTQPTKVKAKWSAKVYHDSAAIPHTPLLAGTLGGFSVAFGTAPNKFTISSTKAQITGVDDSGDQNGVTVYDLSGILVDNNVAVQIDTAVAA